jgi:hypothetical protein
VHPTSQGPGGARPLPAQPNLEHLKNEAKQRLRSLREADATAKLADACFGHSIGMNPQHWPDIAVILSHHFLKPGYSPPDGGKTCAEVFKDIGIASGSTLSLLKLITWMAKRPSSDGRPSVGMRESGPRMWRTNPLDGGPWEVTTTGSVTTLVDRNGEAARVSQDVYLLASDRLVLDKILRVVETIALNGYETLSFTDGDVIVHTITAQDAGAIIRFLHEGS